MPGNNLSDLVALRSELVKLRGVIRDPRASAGTRRRATTALADCAISVADTALALLGAQQQQPDDGDLV